MGLNSQNKNCHVSLEYITKSLDRKIGLCECHHFFIIHKKFEMIIGPKLDRVNRPLYDYHHGTLNRMFSQETIRRSLIF